MAQVGNASAARKVMPWALRLTAEPTATDAEVAAATAELESDIVFS